ncbi:MAG: hypothetical protein KAI62_03985 [Actinomycetia bacterium]|nr:hypothetical protein [Actinomycetes bacterium]
MSCMKDCIKMMEGTKKEGMKEMMEECMDSKDFKNMKEMMEKCAGFMEKTEEK